MSKPIYVGAIQSGVVDQYIPFWVAQSGLTSGWAIWYSRNGGTWTSVASPDTKISEPDTTNAPGRYRLLADASGMMTMTAGNTSELVHIIIKHAAIEDIDLILELFNNLPANVAQILGNTLQHGGSSPPSPVGYV